MSSLTFADIQARVGSEVGVSDWILVDQARIDATRATMPELPRVREERFITDYGFDRAVAHELTAETEIADYFEALIAAGCKPKLAANWTREEAMRLANELHKPLTVAAPVAIMAKLILLVDGAKVARVEAKADSSELFASGEDPEAFFQLSEWVKQCLTQEPKVVADVQAGKTAAVGRLVGVTMKLAGGKADPNAVKAEIFKQLGVVAP